MLSERFPDILEQNRFHKGENNGLSEDSINEYPSLRWGTEIHGTENFATVTRLGYEYEFTGISAASLSAICARLDGRQSSGAIAQSVNLQPQLVEKVIALLLEHDLAINLREEDHKLFVSGDEFSGVCRTLFPQWKERLFSHSLWRGLSEGTAPRSAFLGWLLESYHFIAGVNVRLSLAVAACGDNSVRRLFAGHYAEEYDHCYFFMSALKAFGVSEREVSEARPLPGTTAVLNFMRQCARADFLQYAVCSGFLESTGEDRRKGRTFFERLTEHYSPEYAGAIKPLIEHINLDEAYGHNSLMEEIVAQVGQIPLKRASNAVSSGAALLETLELWSTDIERHYSGDRFSPQRDSSRYRGNRSFILSESAGN